MHKFTNLNMYMYIYIIIYIDIYKFYKNCINVGKVLLVKTCI